MILPLMNHQSYDLIALPKAELKAWAEAQPVPDLPDNLDCPTFTSTVPQSGSSVPPP
jgi:hypothetical protein